MQFKMDENLPVEAAALRFDAGHGPVQRQLWIAEEGRV